MEKVIEVSGLTKKYGTYTAVNNLSLSITKGEIFGLLGPNGAGKSTTILMLLGLTEPDSGKIRICGTDSVRYPIQVKKKVGYLPEDVGFYDDFTGLENLIYTARLNNLSKDDAKQRAAELLNRVGLSDESDKKVGKYSRGMRQRLGLADVLIKLPEVIILDEPTLGIDPAGVKEFLELIVKLSRKDKITVLFSSHLLHQVQQVCDRMGIFVKGRLLAEGNIDSLAKQLFSTNMFNTECGILPAIGTRGNAKSRSVTENDLLKKLQQIHGVAQVKMNNDHFQIESESDVAREVAQVVVNSGFGLSYLNKKEYGLDDIYYQYFQGGNDYAN